MASIKKMVLAAAAGLWASSAEAALVVHTSAFIAAPERFNGFEGAGQYQPYNTPYGEDGIDVTFDARLGGTPYLGQVYVGNGSGISGDHGWFADPGAPGFTIIRLQSRQPFRAIQFTMASSWTDGRPRLLYQLRRRGDLVAEGSAGPVPLYNGGRRTLGFSGVEFDEVRLQQPNVSAAFGAISVRDGEVLDDITVGAAAPEPATWALTTIGLVGAGVMLRWRGRSRLAQKASGGATGIQDCRA